MFQALKLMSLASGLKAKGNAQEAYSAVLELGRIGNEKALDLLIGALARRDGVARSAARELGKLRVERAIQPLAALLGDGEVSQAAADALLAYGAQAVAPLLEVLKSGDGIAREAAAGALGELRDKRAVEPLVLVLQTDDVYAVRTAAATALGHLKDTRAIWVLVQTLQLRDETTPERQAALGRLRTAAQLAMRKIGDPFATSKPGAPVSAAQAAVEQMEQAVAVTEVHPKLISDVKLLSDGELIELIEEVIKASEEVSWASLESREPLVPPYFKSYGQRVQVAEIVGEELKRRGGKELVRRIHQEQLGGNTAVGNWWTDLLN
jgi:HEAT repeat protein